MKKIDLLERLAHWREAPDAVTLGPLLDALIAAITADGEVNRDLDRRLHRIERQLGFALADFQDREAIANRLLKIELSLAERRIPSSRAAA